MTAELDPKNISQGVPEGQLPVGMTVLPERKVTPDQINNFARLVARLLPPAQGKVVAEAFHLEQK
jgi:hypothetical protein